MRTLDNHTLRIAALALLVALTAIGCEDDEPAAQADWVVDVTASPGSHPILTAPDVPAVSSIIVNVYNENGVPQGGIGLRCSTSGGQLDSDGSVITTDSSGTARDTLRTTTTAKVRCQSGAAFGEADVTIGDVNNRPSAAISINPQNEAKIGATTTFSGSQSSDLDGRIVEYRWSLLSTNPDPGKPNPELLTFGEGEDAFSRTFQNAQTIEVTLNVIDDLGAISSPPSVENYAIVANLNPTADAGPGQTGQVNTSNPSSPTGISCTVSQVSGCGSRDPDGSILTYRWNWGDGREDFVSGPCTFGHTYFPSSLPATFTVTLTVYDNGDGTCSPRTPVGSDPCTTRGTDEDTTTVSCPAP
ncbi:MAG: hypothetical protein HC882_08220 [Acidobacteria bacterium]|nr:hypothetical protein [Acidobacteriota bacterium]